jgi:predicted amidophosphoribosyltransferase
MSWRNTLCASCAQNLFTRRELMWREREGYGISSLFRWERDGWLGLRWWLATLKGKEDPRFWREPALWALESFARPRRAPLLVPIPSRQRPANHALGFARALHDLTGWPVAELLKVSDTHAQKRRTREQRRHRRIELIEGSFCNKSTSVLLLDDIVTTGSTVQAAYRALGRPRDTQVWCLADRSLSSLAGS